jgi:hypothetical protein
LKQFAVAQTVFARRCLEEVVGPLGGFYKEQEEAIKRLDHRYLKLNSTLSTLLVPIEKKRKEYW